MLTASTWNIGQSQILSRRELAAVLASLAKRAKRSRAVRTNLMIVRLACCCGLRVSEICQLRMADLVTGGLRPHIAIRKSVGKGGRARKVPLWWDAGTLADITAWKALRAEEGAGSDAYLLCSCHEKALTRQGARFRFQTACKALGAERVQSLTIHHGRHTFISHALAGGRTLAEVRDAAGHSSVITTSGYLHVAVDDDGQAGCLFPLTP